MALLCLKLLRFWCRRQRFQSPPEPLHVLLLVWRNKYIPLSDSSRRIPSKLLEAILLKNLHFFERRRYLWLSPKVYVKSISLFWRACSWGDCSINGVLVSLLRNDLESKHFFLLKEILLDLLVVRVSFSSFFSASPLNERVFKTGEITKLAWLASYFFLQNFFLSSQSSLPFFSLLFFVEKNWINRLTEWLTHFHFHVCLSLSHFICINIFLTHFKKRKRETSFKTNQNRSHFRTRKYSSCDDGRNSLDKMFFAGHDLDDTNIYSILDIPVGHSGDDKSFAINQRILGSRSRQENEEM